MAITATKERVRFPGIHPNAFEHPLDRTALEALRKTPGLDLLLKKLSASYVERIVRLQFTADSMRLSPGQCPRVYSLLEESASVLDMPLPDLYLSQSPFPNAFAIGMERHTIVLWSGLLELLDDDELRFVLAHELGHIKSGHMLYHTMALFLSIVGLVAARNLPFVNLLSLSQALLYAFYDWRRKSELTSDRAGLLVAQDKDVGIRTMLKLAGGSRGVAETLSVDEFLKQADDLEDMGANLLDAIYLFDMTRFQSHPFPALRAREILRWSESEDYRAIMRGEYPRVDGEEAPRRCGRCGTDVYNPTFTFCPNCGTALGVEN
jgi:Zn-dependent protease with chaperone function